MTASNYIQLGSLISFVKMPRYDPKRQICLIYPSIKMNSKICLFLFSLLVTMAVFAAAENSEENNHTEEVASSRLARSADADAGRNKRRKNKKNSNNDNNNNARFYYLSDRELQTIVHWFIILGRPPRKQPRRQKRMPQKRQRGKKRRLPDRKRKTRPARRTRRTRATRVRRRGSLAELWMELVSRAQLLP